MSVLAEIEQKAAEWVLKKELPGAIRAGVSFVVGFLTSGKPAEIMGHYGISINPDTLSAALLQLATGAAATGALHLALGWIGHHLLNRKPS